MSTVVSEIDYQSRSYHILQPLLQQAGIGLEGQQPYDLQIHNPQLFSTVLKAGSLGLGESYMDGWWDCERLDMFFDRALRHGLDKKLPSNLNDLIYAVSARLFNLQSRRRAGQVAREHYDLGNDLFEAILDPHMQYSCAYWKEAKTLEQAQEAKLDLICRKLDLQPGQRVLDIGCGWGGLAAYMARNYGVEVTGITISQEQCELARQRCAGLPVTLRLMDYRDLDQPFERIVSVGMFEHVGPKNYATYFNTVKRCLHPEGRFLLHTIGSNISDHGVDPWINRYIFPNGRLPSMRDIVSCSEGMMVMEDWHNLGSDYDKTLMAWEARFRAAWPRLKDRYGERFYRMFRYYLCACAGAFRARDIQLWQVLFSPHGVSGGVRAAR
ncbi:cyclopropane fatty acyl phospholipid synthase [Edwardsiella piscicida]|nr:cyclopropane fatty acyl phospholipid synthase [Edwardsiella piscicida]ELM3728938.1 cyclopropane fatty acyl phospholipid synthase [Edwardsiella piscicida]ELV7535782.1 cyclopropane fatty acyl phospholipid synthase [Edwardsiella piscicida]